MYADPVQKVTLASLDKDQSLAYWSQLLGLQVYNQNEKHALLGYADDQTKLELQFIGGLLQFELTCL